MDNITHTLNLTELIITPLSSSINSTVYDRVMVDAIRFEEPTGSETPPRYDYGQINLQLHDSSQTTRSEILESVFLAFPTSSSSCDLEDVDSIKNYIESKTNITFLELE